MPVRKANERVSGGKKKKTVRGASKMEERENLCCLSLTFVA